jgi:hypothetical protein
MTGDRENYVIVHRLREHVLGENGPTQSLLDEGRLPVGWAEEYLKLLRIATERWQHQPLWPRELVAAIHFASWYLPLRYDVWRALHNRSRNETTERELASLRSPSELFLMHGALDAATKAT